MSSKDYLTEDSILPKEQKFVCISFLSDPDNKVTLSGIKIRGVFPDIDSASEHAKKLQSIDPAHNVFVGEMGKWLAFDPDTTSEAAGNPEYANEQLTQIEGLRIYGDNKQKTAVISFNIDSIHPYDVGTLLDKMGIAVRTGHHCAQPIMDYYKIPGTIRASFAFYNTKDDVDTFVNCVQRAVAMLR